MEWIPVTERLPEEPFEVLVTSNKYPYVVTIANYWNVKCRDSKWEFFYEPDQNCIHAPKPDNSICGYLRLEDITHWMPLPEPPVDS